MIRAGLIALALAAPVTAEAQAMTIEDCQRVRSLLATSVKGLDDLRLAPQVTEDGWCRVIDGPLGAGLEWQLQVSGEAFSARVRQEKLEFDGLGPFRLTGAASRGADDRLTIGPIRLETKRGDVAALDAVSPSFAAIEAGEAAAGLERAALVVTGERGLIDEVLAWAFRLDLDAAQSSLITARDQRETMLTWLEEEARAVIDDASASAFAALVRAYPRARGTAEIAIREDQPVPLGGLASAVLFGTPLSRGQAAGLVREAGLRFTWSPR